MDKFYFITFAQNLRTYKISDYVLDTRIGLLNWKMRHGLQQKDELIDYAIRSGAPLEVLENLQEIEDEGDVYESIEDIWPDYPTKEDFLFNEDEY